MKQLHDWCALNIPTVIFKYCTNEDHNKETVMLEEWFRKAQTHLGKKKFTFIIPVSNTETCTEVFSEANI
jgi:pyridoxal/pyridoxine/pyridoxamine kinase